MPFSVFAEQFSNSLEYAPKVRGAIFENDAATWPSCLQVELLTASDRSAPSVAWVLGAITNCEAQSFIYREAKDIVRDFYEDYCGKSNQLWPFDFSPVDVEAACKIAIEDRLAAIDARERNHEIEIEWLRRCHNDRRKQKLCNY